LRAASLRALPRPCRHHRPLASHGARPFDVRRGARPRRRVCAELVARPRPAPDAPHALPDPSTEKRNCLMIEFLREPLRFAVAGLGYWGPNLVRNLHDVEDAEVAWICDLNTDALDVIGRRYPAVKRTTSINEVLADDTVDAIAIATPVTTHS